MTTARDLAMLGRRAMRGEVVQGFVTIKEAVVTWTAAGTTARPGTGGSSLPWGDGIKPGYTPLAKYCLAAAGQPGLRPLISTTLRADAGAQHARQRRPAVVRLVALRVAGRRAARRRGRAPDPARRQRAPLRGRDVAAGCRRARAGGGERAVSLVAGLAAAPAPGAHVGTATYRADGETLGTVDVYRPRCRRPTWPHPAGR